MDQCGRKDKSVLNAVRWDRLVAWMSKPTNPGLEGLYSVVFVADDPVVPYIEAFNIGFSATTQIGSTLNSLIREYGDIPFLRDPNVQLRDYIFENGQTGKESLFRFCPFDEELAKDRYGDDRKVFQIIWGTPENGLFPWDDDWRYRTEVQPLAFYPVKDVSRH